MNKMLYITHAIKSKKDDCILPIGDIGYFKSEEDIPANYLLVDKETKHLKSDHPDLLDHMPILKECEGDFFTLSHLYDCLWEGGERLLSVMRQRGIYDPQEMEEIK
jgi:hypothetical protein